ncbi:MAG: hypothetical protein JRJ49_09495, partial [Deltaproteobacteria bacterium]|nr:hypothetical protein [Deltaproteobacteria bacterium]
VLSLDKNKDLVSVNNISNYIGADYTINFDNFKLIPRIGLTTIYNSDSYVIVADTGLKFKADITDNLELTNEIKFSDLIKSKEIDKTVFDNLIINETGFNLKYKKITAGLIYGFSNGAQTSSEWIGFNFNYNF